MRFANFEIDPAACELRRDGVRIPVGPQPVRLLLFLVERTGTLVTREELYRAIWADADVDVDRALNTCIRQLRSALGERAGAERFIHTYPRRGYRFTVPTDAAPPAPPRPVTRFGGIRVVAPAVAVVLLGIVAYVLAVRDGAGDPPRVVIFPFRSLVDSSDQVIAAGFTETVLTTLAVIEPTRLQVLGWTPGTPNDSTPIEYARRAFDADFVVLGTYQLAGATATINLRVVSTRNGEVVWARHVSNETPGEHLVPLQLAAGIARSVLGSVPDRLAEHRSVRAPNALARLDFVQGGYLLQHPDVSRRPEAIPHLERAVKHDPDYAPAHARLAEALFWDERFAEARTAADRALTLAPDDPHALFMRGNIRLVAEWDWSGAEPDIQRAVSLLPGRPEYHSGYAFLLATSGRHAEAVSELELARHLDPVSPLIAGDLGLIYYWAGDYRSAAELCVRTVTLEPSSSYGYACAFSAYVALERWPQALEQARQIVASTGLAPDSVLGGGSVPPLDAVRRFRVWRVKLLQKSVAEGAASPYWLAVALADLGHTDAALTELERAATKRSMGLVTAAVDPRFTAVRHDPRFAAVLEKLSHTTH